jgi:hypothetical protein
LNDHNNWVHLGFLAADESSHAASDPINRKLLLSAKKFCYNFKGFGFDEEEVLLYRLFKSVGKPSQDGSDHVFTLEDLDEYFKLISKADPLTESSIKMFVA